MATATEVQSTGVAVELELDRQPYGRPASFVGYRDDQPGEGQAQQLKPVDGGRDAWGVLISMFVFEALLWGFPMSFGVFQDYYASLAEFSKDQSNIALIGTLAQGMAYIGAPASAYLTKRFHAYQKRQILVGWPMSIGGLLCASFVSSVDGLIVTQGFLYGLGFVITTYPLVSMVNEWWVARKGMAFGLVSAASGATGTFFPFLLRIVLERYGHRTTLRASAVALALLTAPLIPLLKTRLPSSEQSSIARTDWSFLRHPLFYVYAVSILLQGFGFAFPIVFLPTYATALGFTSMQGAMLLAVMSVSQVIGQFTFGWLSDHHRLSVSVLAGVCLLASAVSSLTLWGLAVSLPVLSVFSIVYGFFAFGFGTMRVAMGQAVSKEPSAVFATYAIFVFFQGVGNVLVGPLSGALLASRETVLGHYASGRFEGPVIFTGTTSLTAALVIVFWHSHNVFNRRSEPRT